MASYERRQWPGDPSGFTRSQRVGGAYHVYLPDKLAGRVLDIPDDVLVALEEASLELGRLEISARSLRDTEALARTSVRVSPDSFDAGNVPRGPRVQLQAVVEGSPLALASTISSSLERLDPRIDGRDLRICVDTSVAPRSHASWARSATSS